MAHEVNEAFGVSLTREQVFGLEAKVSLGSVSLELDPELWGKDHSGKSGGRLPTKPGQQLPICVT